MERIASIDVGSNTLRLLVAEKKKEDFQVLFRDREIVRLGRNFFPDRLLLPQTIEAAVKVLKRFKTEAERSGVERVIAAGTGVLREAKNIRVLLSEVEAQTGIVIRVLGGLEEAALMAKGVLSIFPPTDQETVIFDNGGGSTEFVFINHGRIAHQASLPLGVVGLTEAFLKSDPPTLGEVQTLREFSGNILRKNFAGNDKNLRLIGTAGTVTTLAAMISRLDEYEPGRINGVVLFRAPLEGLLQTLLSLPCKERAGLTGLEPGRADIIPAGLLLVLEMMTFFNQESLLVSDAGLLEGLILEPVQSLEG
jgi:exopolyphosphatase/guanosine-5'-triphosphate,3'-diphosphate pyrophosphatase